tara:strand:+ start:4481 stop:4666 length:186 start_codon:yes stop_codon:yes gene_type:complete
MDSISRRKSKGSARSRMLRKVMPKLSGTEADQLGKAIDNENEEQFRRIWQKIGKNITDTFK